MWRLILLFVLLINSCSRNLSKIVVDRSLLNDQNINYVLALCNFENLPEKEYLRINVCMKFRNKENFLFIKKYDEILKFLIQENEDVLNNQNQLNIPPKFSDQIILTNSNEIEILAQKKLIIYYSPIVKILDHSGLPKHIESEGFDYIMQRIYLQGGDEIEVMKSYYFFKLDENGFIVQHFDSIEFELFSLKSH